MRIKNSTNWCTADFKRILQRVAAEELEPPHRKRLRVEIHQMRGRQNPHGWCRGFAYIRGYWMKLTVPKEYVDPVDFAFVAAHEMAHCRGLDHPNMRHPRYRRMGDQYRTIYGWAGEMTIMAKAARPAPTVYDKLTNALAHAQRMLERHARRMRLQLTVTKRWQRRVAYYQRRLEATAAAQAVRRAQ